MKKKSFFMLLPLFCFALAFTGCSKDSDDGGPSVFPPAHLYSIDINPPTATVSVGSPVSFASRVYEYGVEDSEGSYNFVTFKDSTLGETKLTGPYLGTISSELGNISMDSYNSFYIITQTNIIRKNVL